MAQHIGLRREDGRGRPREQFVDEGVPLELLKLAPGDGPCLRFVDPYGDTVFNQLQLPALIGEIERIAERVESADLRRRLTAVVAFLAASQGVHQYVRFVGD